MQKGKIEEWKVWEEARAERVPGDVGIIFSRKSQVKHAKRNSRFLPAWLAP